MNIKRQQIVDIVSALVSAACAVLCTLITGCRLSMGEMSVKEFNVEIVGFETSETETKE